MNTLLSSSATAELLLQGHKTFMGKGEMISEVLTKLGSTSLFPTAREKAYNLKNNKNNPLRFFQNW